MSVMERPSWTDERLDDLKSTVDTGFGEMRTEFRELRREMIEQFQAQHRMVAQLLGGMIVALVVGFLGVIATIITQT